MPKLQALFMLSDKGYSDLKKSIAACTLTNFSLMLPFTVIIQMILQLIKPLQGESISWGTMWLLFGLGVVAAVIVFLCSKLDYKKHMWQPIWKAKKREFPSQSM
jgi:ATP-binding cassette subfamily B protein IrtB